VLRTTKFKADSCDEISSLVCGVKEKKISASDSYDDIVDIGNRLNLD